MATALARIATNLTRAIKLQNQNAAALQTLGSVSLQQHRMKTTDEKSETTKGDKTEVAADKKTPSAEDAMKFANEKAEAMKEGMGAGKQNLKELFGVALKGYTESMKSVKDSRDSVIGKSPEERAQKMAQTQRKISDNVDYAAKAGVQRVVGDAAAHVHKELLKDDAMAQAAAPYVAPLDRRRDVLEKRARREHATVLANDEAQSMMVRQQSTWEKLVNKVSDHPALDRVNDWKVEWEESDSFFARSTRRVKEGLEDSVGGLMEETEMAYVVDEIRYVDPMFNEQDFVLHCERVVFPACIEAWLSGDKEVLKDWFGEGAYQVFSADIDDRNAKGLRIEYKILDLADTVVQEAKMDDDSPLITLYFQVTQNKVVRNKSGEIIEGSENDISKVHFFGTMRRNQEESDPLLAWNVHMLQPVAENKMLV